MNHLDMVREFHEAFDVNVRTMPTADIPMDERILRASLVLEEALEFVDAMGCSVMDTNTGRFVEGEAISISPILGVDIDLVGAADALADIDYVVQGSALTLGIPHKEVFAEVHRSNMAKLGPDGKPILREGDNKVLKPEGWTKPDIVGVLGR